MIPVIHFDAADRELCMRVARGRGAKSPGVSSLVLVANHDDYGVAAELAAAWYYDTTWDQSLNPGGGIPGPDIQTEKWAADVKGSPYTRPHLLVKEGVSKIGVDFYIVGVVSNWPEPKKTFVALFGWATKAEVLAKKPRVFVGGGPLNHVVPPEGLHPCTLFWEPGMDTP